MEQTEKVPVQQPEQLIEQALMEDYAKLYRLAYQYVRNENDALDIVQESAYKAVKNSGRLQSPQYVKTWLYRIVINESLSFLRRKKPDVLQLSEAEGETEDAYADLDLHRALMRLSDDDKTIVVLRFFEGLSFQQIADILDENIKTVKSRLYRSLQKLKQMLEEGGAVSCEAK